MSQFPSLPLYTDAFIADTMHLSAAETGAYLMLLMVAWRSPGCRLPDDDQKLARWARVDPRAWSRIRRSVMEFWTLADGWVEPRLGVHAHADWSAHPCRWDRRDWKLIRAQVIGRDGECCSYCGSTSGPFSVDHVIPRVRGGRNTPENLRVACRPCNSSKGSRLLEEWSR